MLSTFSTFSVSLPITSTVFRLAVSTLSDCFRSLFITSAPSVTVLSVRSEA